MEDRDLPPPSIVHRENFDLPGDASPKEKSEFRRSPVQTRKTWKRYEEDVLSGSRIADRPFLRRLRPHGYPLADDPYRPEAPFKKPALFLHGRQDHIVGYRDAFKILEFFPRASYVVLDRAGHNLQIDQPALFEALVREWLFRVAETAGN
jgi:pimeloyl-ACP methyl ester carboxylesterase